ncbi:MAG TPA: hypothetical protein VKN63_06930 [Afifellaceae bacterium]|nr:hypothetical protein [Afifellaceae bacterium]
MCVGLALAGALADTPARDGLPGSLLSYSRSSAVADAILVLALSAIVHIATDFPLHVLDGHPAFWPVSEWIFQSGISYWDPHYYGNVISLAELALAGGLIVLLWLRFRSWMVRCVLLSAAFSYGAIAYHWATAF